MNNKPSGAPSPETVAREIEVRKPKIELWQWAIGVLAVIVSGFFGAKAWVEDTAENAVLSEKFLAELAGKVRPTCVFDSNDSILFDSGTSEYIDSIDATQVPEKFGFRIQIRAKRHLIHPPLVSCLNASLFAIESRRQGNRDWEVILTPMEAMHMSVFVDTGPSMNTNILYRFKLEILH